MTSLLPPSLSALLKTAHPTTDDQERALGELLRELRRYPCEVTLNERAAELSLRLGERSLALSLLAKAVELGEGQREEQREGQRARCVLYLELLSQEERFEEALSFGLQSLRRWPSDARLSLLTGYAIEKLKARAGDPDVRVSGLEQALAYYERAQALGEEGNLSLYLHMRALYRLGRLSEALKLASPLFEGFTRAYSVNTWELFVELLEVRLSQPSDLSQDLSDELNERERLEAQLLKTLAWLISQDPQHKRAHERLARYYMERDDKRAYEHAFKSTGLGASASAYLLLCHLELKRGKREQARHAFESYERLKRSPLSAEELSLKAQCDVKTLKARSQGDKVAAQVADKSDQLDEIS